MRTNYLFSIINIFVRKRKPFCYKHLMHTHEHHVVCAHNRSVSSACTQIQRLRLSAKTYNLARVCKTLPVSIQALTRLKRYITYDQVLHIEYRMVACHYEIPHPIPNPRVQICKFSVNSRSIVPWCDSSHHFSSATSYSESIAPSSYAKHHIVRLMYTCMRSVHHLTTSNWCKTIKA